MLLLAVALTGCKSPAKKPKDKKEAAQAKKDAQTTEDSADVDFQAFVGRLRQAVEARDMNTIAAHDDARILPTPWAARRRRIKRATAFFSIGTRRGCGRSWPGILSEKFVKKEDFMVAPPQFADPAVAYDGYRAGIRRVSGSWKFVYFVNG